MLSSTPHLSNSPIGNPDPTPPDAGRHDRYGSVPPRIVEKVAGWLSHLIDPDQVVEVRALKVQGGRGRGDETHAGTFRGDELGEMARAALAISGWCQGVYYTLNPLRPSKFVAQAPRVMRADRRAFTATDADVLCRRWLLVDIDRVKDAATRDLSATDAERAAVWEVASNLREYLRGRGWPAPVVSDSGNGAHLFYRLSDLPVGLPLKPDDPVKLVLQHLADKFDTVFVSIDTKVFNPARIVKFPGTLACKGRATEDRPHRRAMLLEAPDEVVPVPLDELHALAALAPAPKTTTAAAVHQNGRSKSRADSRRTTITGHLAHRIREYLKKPDVAVAGMKGHDRTFYVANRLVRGYNLSPADAYPFFAEWNQTCDPPWSEQELLHKLNDAERAPGSRGFLLNGHAEPADEPLGDEPLPRGALHRCEGDAFDNPHRLAAEFLRYGGRPAGPAWLRYWRDTFYEWDRTAYRVVESNALSGRLNRFVRRRFQDWHEIEMFAFSQNAKEGQKPPTVRPVTTQVVTNTAHALKGLCLLLNVPQAPAWVDGETGPDPRNLIAAPNAVLDLNAVLAGHAAATMLPSNPDLFTTTGVEYAVDPHAPPPSRWLAFLNQLWPDDPQAVDLLAEWFGYCLVADTSRQKMLWLLGPSRAGKGVICRVLKKLIGEQNVSTPTFQDLATEFGLSNLLDKSLAVIGDGRLSNRSDAVAVTARLLQIVGEDGTNVNRKGIAILGNVRLGCRFVITSNELPNLVDHADALVARSLALQFTESFVGREDPHLGDRLEAELPGILCWAIQGLARLRANGRFTEPESGLGVKEELQDLLSPVGKFLREVCDVKPTASVDKGELYQSWRSWCLSEGRDQPGTKSVFYRNLYACRPGLRPARPRDGEKRVQRIKGIRVRGTATPDQDDPTPDPGGRSGLP